jgi:hypothetical protein
MTELWPASGPVRGGTAVVLAGDFSQAVQWCRFAGPHTSDVVLARWLSPKRVECITPATELPSQEPVTIEISVNGQQYTRHGLAFAYLPELELFELQPAQGPVQGGSLLTLIGSGLSAYGGVHSQIACNFNATFSAPAEITSSHTLRCFAPAAIQLGSVLVRITSHDQIISTDLRFEYTAVRLLGASPAAGPIAGGTSILITGVHIPIGELTCRFGGAENMQVQATTDSSSAVVCKSPPRQGDTTRVALELICSSAVCGNALSFEYLADIYTIGVSPTSGPVDGGTRVEIVGREFHDSGALFCRFGFVKVPALWMDSTRYACFSPVWQPGTVNVTVSLNGQQFTPAKRNVSFYYRPRTMLRHLLPARGPQLGGTLVNIIGDHLEAQMDQNILVRFEDVAISAGSILVQGTFERGHVRCISPPLSLGYAGIAVSVNNGVDFSDQIPFLVTSPSLRASRADGETLYASVGAEISVLMRGRHLYDLPMSALVQQWSCQLVDAASPSGEASFVSTDGMQCNVAPPMGAGAFPLALYGAGHVLAGPTVHYHDMQNVTLVTPLAGPRAGGTTITIELDGISVHTQHSLWCLFGTSQVPAMQKDARRIKCVSPALEWTCGHCRAELDAAACQTQEHCHRNPPATVPVQVTVDGRYQLSLPFNFTYMTELRVKQIWPYRGPAAGDTLLWVRGSAFSPETRCQFNELAVVASFVSDELLTCRTPRGSPGYVSIEVTDNGGNDFSSSGMVFAYEAATIVAASPSSGPIRGGPQIVITGHNLLPDVTACLINGAVRVAANFVSPRMATCEMPSHPRGMATIEMITTSGNATVNGNALFYFEDPARVIGVHPMLGPVQGGTQITISGEGFVESAMLVCRLQLAHSQATTVTSAHWISSHFIRCMTPREWPAVSVGTVAVIEVSMNGQDF